MVKLQIEGNFAGKKKLYSGLSFCNGGEIERREHGEIVTECNENYFLRTGNHYWAFAFDQH